MTGSNFSPSKSLSVKWMSTGATLATVTTNSSGAFSTSTTVPSPLAAGTYYLSVADSSQAPTVGVSIERKISTSATSSQAAGNSAVSWSGLGFAANATVTLSMTGKTNGTTTTLSTPYTADGNGSISSSFTVPQLDGGWYWLKATDSGGSATITFGVSIYGSVTTSRTCADWPWENDKFKITVSGTQPNRSMTCVLSGGESGTYTISINSSGNGSWSKNYGKWSGASVKCTQAGNNDLTFIWNGSSGGC